MTKSNPEIYRSAAKRLGKLPSEVIFVDDNVIAVRTAKEAGMIPYGIFDESSKDLRAEMISVSERYLDTFSEILLDTDSEDKKRALFIGNSYTFFSSMPTILETLAHENGYPLQVDSVTKGGRKLYANLTEGDEYNAKILDLTSKNKYDALFLQEQSYFALVDYDKFLFGLSELIKLVNARRVILYATWGRKAGAPLLDELKLTSEEMTNALTKAYVSASKTLGTEISLVGSAFLALSKSHPNIELYNDDKSHPSYIGSVLAAISHYNALFGEMPTKHDTLNISDELFSLLVRAAEEVIDES